MPIVLQNIDAICADTGLKTAAVKNETAISDIELKCNNTVGRAWIPLSANRSPKMFECQQIPESWKTD